MFHMILREGLTINASFIYTADFIFPKRSYGVAEFRLAVFGL